MQNYRLKISFNNGDSEVFDIRANSQLAAEVELLEHVPYSLKDTVLGIDLLATEYQGLDDNSDDWDIL